MSSLLVAAALSVASACADLPCARVPARVQLCGSELRVWSPRLGELSVVRGRAAAPGAVQELLLLRARGGAWWSAPLHAPAGNYSAYVGLQYKALDPEDAWRASHTDAILADGCAFWHPGEAAREEDARPCPRSPALFARSGFWEASVESPRYSRGARLLGARNATYVPRGCALPRGRDGPSPPGACFFGDSQTRHLHNQWCGAPAAARRLPRNNETVRAVEECGASAYVDNPYGECFAGAMPWGTTGRMASRSNVLARWRTRCRPSLPCAVAFLNFGQWLVSHAIGEHARAQRLRASEYAERAVKAMRVASETHPCAVWLTTHPLGEGWASLYGLEPRELRTDGVLRAYNSAAARAVAAAGFEVYDVFGVANALHDWSYDGSHYCAPVEAEIARLVGWAAAPLLDAKT
jgi:hypothetical protein